MAKMILCEVTEKRDFSPLNYHQFSLESKWTFVPNWKKFPQDSAAAKEYEAL